MIFKDIKGFKDEPIHKDGDKLNRYFYVNALEKIVMECDTPMTISVSGEWGIGKTSFVNLLKSNVQENKEVKFIDFNVWKISQFESNNSLKYSLFKSLIGKIVMELEMDEKNATKLYKRFIKSFNLYNQEITLGKEDVAAIKISKEAKSQETEFDSLDIVSEMECLMKELEKELEKSNKRIIIFIDDLDRIEPQVSVEILEFLKLFLSFKNCVYLLAVDEDVISQGLKLKYEKLPNKFKDSRNYFEKIIQLPFYLPNALSDSILMKNYIDALVSEGKEGLSINSSDYVVGSLMSIRGYNPRKIKRILNSSWLYKLVLEEKEKKDNSVIYIDDIIFIVCFKERVASRIMCKWKKPFCRLS
ncbi:KAP family P-loop NTPase fold protein [Vagococcus carniphilus]|uniref:KAP family P-loop NTPase fold protein n=1 Tax=Vagococcus carniphilus TaxID=218144 RepID=UPI003BAC0F93